MPEEIYDTTVHFLDPRTITARRDRMGRVILDVDGEEHAGIKPTRAFPQTDPDLFISVAGEDGKEIGVIENLAELDPSARAVLEDELELVYFSPVIQKIEKVIQHYGATSWQVQTDRGPQMVRVRERGDIRWLSPTRVVLADVHGVRYQVPDSAALDEHSRTLLEQEG